MSITYEDALVTLQSMFGAPWSRETLDAVLRHHGGHMENTIETVLSNGDRDPQLLVQQLKTGGTSLDEEIARQLDQEERNATNPRGGGPPPPQQRRVITPASSAPQREQRGTPTTLPPDFLRVPGRPIGSSSNASNITLNTSSANTVDADEALARMLQDEFFAEELANNPEFAHLARGRPRTIGGMPARQSFTTPGMSQQQQQQQQGRIGELPSRSFGSASQPQRINRPGEQQDFNFMEKISELGDNAKRRLATLVAQFNASKNANQSRGGAGGTSGIAAERRSLLDDEEDAIEFMSRKDK